MFSKFALLTSADELRIAVTAHECAHPLTLTFGLRSRARKAPLYVTGSGQGYAQIWNLSYRLRGESAVTTPYQITIPLSVQDL